MARQRIGRSANVKVAALVLAIGLVPMGVATVLLARHSRANTQADLDRSLASQADAQAAALEHYFERAQSIVLLTSRNPAFREFYELPGERAAKVRSGGLVVDDVNRALAYLQQLFPDSIGEACFIDHTGPENARVVRGVRAVLSDLSPDESGNPFFAPTFALPVGQVHQSKPYVSPDTGEWVVSNSTVVPTGDGQKKAIVHFEVTVESLRSAAAASARRHIDIAVVDAHTGAVIMDSNLPQLESAELGRPEDRRFAPIAARGDRMGLFDVAGRRAAYQRLRQTPGNANDWYVMASSEPAELAWFGGADAVAIAILGAALLLVGLGMARRWVRANAELERRAHAQQEAAERLAAQNEDLRALDRLKDEFVALVSHELRTPLTSILGYLELVLDGDAGELTDEQRRFLQVVRRNSARLLRLVGDLLFVAQVESGTLALKCDRVDIGAVAAESVQALQPRAEAAGVELVLATEPVPAIEADHARIAQLVDNLLSNAIKFTPQGGRVRIGTSSSEDEILLEVSDTGIGIPPDEQNRLFERFFRASTATERAIQGTGLGLAITKAIVDAHRGRISFESAEGAGTSFRVALPLIRGGAPKPEDSARGAPELAQGKA